IIKAEELRTRYDVSLSVVREVVRVIESLGMLRPIRRVGLVVLAMDEWTLLDLLVIRWRMTEAPARQLRSLPALRVAIDPDAAGPTGRGQRTRGCRAGGTARPRRGGRRDHGTGRPDALGRKEGRRPSPPHRRCHLPPGGARRRRQRTLRRLRHGHR